MDGLHLTADLAGCPAAQPWMSQPEALRQLCLQAVQAVSLHAVGSLFHPFAAAPGQALPGGVTGVVLLAESHLAVHTWPELGAVTLDVYVCNFGADNSARAEALMQHLLQALAPQRHRLQRLQRAAPGAGGGA